MWCGGRGMGRDVEEGGVVEGCRGRGVVEGVWGGM